MSMFSPKNTERWAETVGSWEPAVSVMVMIMTGDGDGDGGHNCDDDGGRDDSGNDGSDTAACSVVPFFF